MEDFPEEILANMLSSMTFEELLQMRQIPLFREATESWIVLNSLAKRYILPIRGTFVEILEENDKKYFTPRCLTYHKIKDCAKHFAFIGDIDSVHKMEELGWDVWTDGMIAAAKGNQLVLLQYFIFKQSQIESEDFKKALNSTLLTAVRYGHFELVKFLEKLGASDWNQSLINSIKGNRDILIQYFISKNAPSDDLDYVAITTIAAKQNRLDIINYVIERTEPECRYEIMDAGLIGATKSNNLDLVKYFIEHGATDFENALYTAAWTNNRDLIDLFMKLGAHNWDLGMRGAARGNHPDLINFFVDLGGDYDWVEALLESATIGNLTLVKFFVGKCVNNKNFQQVLTDAAYGGHLDIVEYLTDFFRSILSTEKFQSLLTKALVSASYNGFSDVIKYILDQGVVINLDDAIKIAKSRGEIELVEYFKSIE